MVKDVEHVQLRDHDDKYAPPERPTMRISRTGPTSDDIVFFSIGVIDEAVDASVVTETFKFDKTAQIGVGAEELRRVLRILEIV